MTIIWLRFSPCVPISTFFTSSVSVASLSTTTLERKYSSDSPFPMTKIPQIRLRRCRSQFNNETDALQRPRQNENNEIKNKHQKPKATEVPVYRAFNKVSQSQDTCSLSSNISTGKMSMRMRCTKSKTTSNLFKVAKCHSAKTWTRTNMPLNKIPICQLEPHTLLK